MNEKDAILTDTPLALTELPVAKTAMLIRRPVSEVFAAFVDPDVTSKFWFTRGSGTLEPGVTVTWHWDMYGFSTQARTIEIVPDRLILVDWIAGESSTRIEWRFFPRPDDTTFVSITNSGFTGSADEVTKHAVASTEGFTFVLAGAKAWLEHGIELNLVADRFPDGLASPPDAVLA
jgi:uncharacterized protein YndB with AHSA1/START domain